MNYKYYPVYCSEVFTIAVRILVSSFASPINFFVLELFANWESMIRLSQQCVSRASFFATFIL